MKTLNQFLSLLLVFQLVVPIMPAQAQSGNDGDANGNGRPDIYESCALVTEAITSSRPQCCEGLTQIGNTCTEVVLSDPEIQTCSGHSTCSAPKGCYEQRSKDLFKNDESKRGELEGQIAGNTPLANGQSCSHAGQCASYNCADREVIPFTNIVRGVCKEKAICRLADLDESAPGAIQCGAGLIKNTQGKCVRDPNTTDPVYLGLVNDVAVNQVGQCQFDIAEDTRIGALAGMKTLRALEFTFGQSKGTDLIGMIPHMRTLVQNYTEQRKMILADFNRLYDQMENDNATLLRAKENDTNMVTIHNAQSMVGTGGQAEGAAEPITNHDLATRQSSGYDALMMMWRRNLLFQSYESNMASSILTLQQTFSKLNTEMPAWHEGAESWTLDGQNKTASRHYKKWVWTIFPDWKGRDWRNIKNLWYTHYAIHPVSHAKNQSIIDRPIVTEYLKYITGDDSALTAFKTDRTIQTPFGAFPWPVYLIDPLMPGTDFHTYGSKINSWGKCGGGWFSGFFDSIGTNSNIHECRGGNGGVYQPRSLDGNGNRNLESIYNAMKPKVKEFYLTLKPQGTQNFVYEPELISTAGFTSDGETNEQRRDCSANAFNETTGEYIKCARDCLENPNNPGCGGYASFLEEIADISFAQFLAFSHHNNPKYTNYFDNELTLRRKLLTRIEADLVFLGNYYSEVNRVRDMQNECIEKLINKVVDDLNADANSGGLNEGHNYYATPNGQNLPGRQYVKTSSRIPKLTPASRTNFSFGTTSKMYGTGGSNLDSMGKSANGGGAGSSSSNTAVASAFSKRLQEMKASNKKAKEKGVAVDQKEKTAAGTLASLGNKAGAMRGGTSSSSALGSGFGALGGANFNAALSGDLNAKDGEMGDLNTGGAVAGATAGMGDGQGAAGAFGGLNAHGKGLVGGASSGGEYTDPTGMSDEEKDVLMANYERTKGRYQTEEGDGLFKIVSKAYVRNLEKVLTRKKKTLD